MRSQGGGAEKGKEIEQASARAVVTIEERREHEYAGSSNEQAERPASRQPSELVLIEVSP